MTVSLRESNTTEQLIIDALKSNGWKYIPSNAIPRRTADVIAEPLLKSALIRLNPCIAESPSRADEVIYRLRSKIHSVNPQNLITHNEAFRKLIFEENSYPFGKNGRMTPVRIFGTVDRESLSLNEYIVTNQFTYGSKRPDIVLLVNGIPLVIGELKTPVRNSVSWIDAVNDIADYERSITPLFVPNVFSFASDEKNFRYGSVGMSPEWFKWRNGERRLEDVRESVKDMLKPERVIDIMQFFTLFAMDRHYRKIKIICRSQQYEGANRIIQRVMNGYPKKGLIWHFQGSGKSLLMIFAAQKLRMMPELKNPTVVIVDDRLDLETQITAAFNASDIPNLESLPAKDERHTGHRKVISAKRCAQLFRTRFSSV